MATRVQQPDTAEAAAAALAGEPEAALLAGGTIVMRNLNEGRSFPSLLVSLQRASLNGIAFDGERVRLGAATPLAALAEEPRLGFLSSMLRGFGGPALRNMASVGGNLFARQPYGDFGLCCLALGADLEVAGAAGTRSLTIDAFYAEGLKPGEVVTAIAFDLPAAEGWRYRKAARRAFNSAAVVAVAANLTLSGGAVKSARIALSGCGPVPRRSPAAEQALVGAALDAGAAERAGQAALSDADCFTDAFASAWYRRRVLPVHLRDALLGG